MTATFFTSKNGNLCANIINVGNHIAVVRKSKKGDFKTYPPQFKEGIHRPELVQEFTQAYLDLVEGEKERLENEKKEYEEALKGLETPYDISEYLGLRNVEVASHWNDLHTGKSTRGIIVTSKKELEELLDCLRINGIEDFEEGEFRNRAGEHHHTFNSHYSHKDYEDRCIQHFDEKLFYRSKDTEEDLIRERLIDMLEDGTDMEYITKEVEEYNNLEVGWYNNGGSLVVAEEEFEGGVFGYSEDVYTYRYGINFTKR